MKICYFASAGSIHTARWANYFSGKGHQVEILSFEPAERLDANINFHHIGMRWPFKLHYFTSGTTARRLLKRIQPDIVHAHYASVYATLARLAGFHPCVISVWGSDIFNFFRQSPLHRSLVAANLKYADRLCATSQIMADEVQSCCGKAVYVTPFGVDCQKFRPQAHSNGSGEFVVGTVKALEPIYGIEYLIRGFAIFSKRNRGENVRLVVAGEGSLKGSLQRLARDLNIEALTTFLGFVPHEKVPEIVGQFSAFVAPSVFESFGVAVVEASACGVPVVASRIGGFAEVVRDGMTGILIPPRDPSAIASALEELRKDEQQRINLGANGRQFVLENYEWTENASRMERIYNSLLTGRN